MNAVPCICLLVVVTFMATTARGEESAAPVKMEPVRVAAIWANAEVRVVYLRDADGPRISMLRVESVREKSAAAKAGLVKGMEIIAIQKVALSGLTEEDYQRLMRSPVVDTFVLGVRRPSRVKTEELRIQIAK